MTVWHLSEYVAWALSAIIAAFLLTDAYRVGRRYDEEYLTHSLDELGSELEVDEHGRVSVDDRRPSERSATETRTRGDGHE